MDNPQDDDNNVETPRLGAYKKLKTLTNKNIFRLTKEDLTLFFEKKNIQRPDNQGECRISLNILKECGYNNGLCKLLSTDQECGIIGDGKDLKRRQKLFGKHFIALPKITSFETLLSRQFEDINVIFLIWAATIYLVLSVFSKTSNAYIESLTIYSGLLFVTLISASCDYIKERQYLKLKDQINDQRVTVYRGAYGTCASIPVRDLVVGDIVDICQGDRVPADCILVEEMNITVDESLYRKGDVKVEKEISTHYGQQQDNHQTHPDPFLFSDTKIMTGQGKAIVCCVGDSTLLARSRRPKDLVIDEQRTFLEEKLEKTATQISKYAVAITIISVITQVFFTILLILFTTEYEVFSNVSIMKFAKIGISAIVLLMVAIPEGLPLAVSIAMALSINSLKKDNILIKNLESVQTCAMLHDICVSKTGTLTNGEMSVVKYQICDDLKAIDNDPVFDPENFTRSQNMSEDIKGYIKECIYSNTDVRIEIDDDNLSYVPKGQPIEVGLIKFLLENGENVPEMLISRNQTAKKLMYIPFDQKYKRKLVARQVSGDPETVRIYVKGAPEFVLPICTQTLDVNVQPKELTENDTATILNHIVSQDMAKGGLKVLSYAFKEMRTADLNALFEQYDVESSDFRKELETDMVYLCTFGMLDELRDDIGESVKQLKFGCEEKECDSTTSVQVNVRILTGDHLDTAKFVGLRTGIIQDDEINVDGIAVTGEEFKEAIGGYDKVWDVKNLEFKIAFREQRKFDEAKKKLRIMARTTAEDKFLFVSGVKQKGGLVGMTGDSISDAEALLKADVGLCMGSGCDVAKDNSDLVILDNNFISIHKSVKWGRAVFENVRKFIQFQLTINIVLCFITILGGVTLGSTPLNVIQMLWTNLIMDILGAIAMCTEPYNPLHQGSRISRKSQIILPEMWRQILVQAAYQIFVLVILMYLGQFIFFEKSFNLIMEKKRNKDSSPTDRLILDTMIFHTFILMNLFNQVNCRIVEANEINIFRTLSPLRHPMFWIVMTFEVFIQQSMINLSETQLGSALLGAGPLNFSMQLTAWILGSLSLVVNVALKQIPLESFTFIEKHVDLESEKRQEWINKYSAQGADLYRKQVSDLLEDRDEHEPQSDEYIRKE